MNQPQEERHIHIILFSIAALDPSVWWLTVAEWVTVWQRGRSHTSLCMFGRICKQVVLVLLVLTGHCHNIVDQVFLIAGDLFELGQRHEELQQNILLVTHVLQLRQTRRRGQSISQLIQLLKQWQTFPRTGKWKTLFQGKGFCQFQSYSFLPHIRQFWK